MIQAIYMAAGNSRRFGSNKLLFPWKGKTMYRHGLDLLLELKKEMKEQLSVIVVTQYPENRLFFAKRAIWEHRIRSRQE